MNRFLLNKINRLTRIFKKHSTNNNVNTISSALVVTLLLSACSTTTNDSIAFNEAAQSQQLTYATNQLKQCKAQGDDIANSALVNQSLPQYLLAAKRYRACSKQALLTEKDRTYITQVSLVSTEHKTTMMQLHVLSVMNFIKAGELRDAIVMVDHFKQAFPQQDFYFANYTSFIDTAEALLQPQHITPQTLATLNISSPLRQELLRKQYWLKN